MQACCDGLGHCTLPLSFIVVHKMLLLCILGFFKEQCHLQLFKKISRSIFVSECFALVMTKYCGRNMLAE